MNSVCSLSLGFRLLSNEAQDSAALKLPGHGFGQPFVWLFSADEKPLLRKNRL